MISVGFERGCSTIIIGENSIRVHDNDQRDCSIFPNGEASPSTILGRRLKLSIHTDANVHTNVIWTDDDLFCFISRWKIYKSYAKDEIKNIRTSIA